MNIEIPARKISLPYRLLLLLLRGLKRACQMTIAKATAIYSRRNSSTAGDFVLSGARESSAGIMKIYEPGMIIRERGHSSLLWTRRTLLGE